MKIHIQWVTYPAQGWIEYDSAEWSILPKKPEDSGTYVPIDDQFGWIHQLNIHGTVFSGDHIALTEKDNIITVYNWDDDKEDYKPEEYIGRIGVFKPFKDIPLNKITTYSGENYKNFPIPEEYVTKHGKWMSSKLLKELQSYPPAPWMYWKNDY